MPPYLACYLIRALSNLTRNILIFPILHAGCLADMEVGVISWRSFAYENEGGQAASMENWQKFEFSSSNFSALLSDKKANEVVSFSHW